MELRVLGPVDLWRDGRSVVVTGLKQRTLLALLVLQANRVVPHDRLLTALWGAEVPATGRRLLHNHLWSVRRLLSDPDMLSGTPTGYSLRLQPGSSDLDVFIAKTATGRSAMSGGDIAKASDQFRAALELWRGPALGGTHPELQLTEGAALEELRIAALVQRIDADLALGRHEGLIGELRLLVAEHPLNEGLRAQLMRAFHHVGRTAEALEEFRIARQHIRDELGLEPGHELTQLHQTILSGGSVPETVSRKPILSPPASSTPMPRQLPADISRFIGREESLRRLDALLGTGQDGASAVVVTAITGTPGIGKTALATCWGHRRAGWFSDGQLYVNLHGYSQREPVTAAQALHYFLRALGVASEEIPYEADERAALYRSLLAGRRMLVVLDNAARADQVRSLLPGSSLCKVVITSRDSLRGLSATHDIHVFTLDVLSTDEAKALLAAILNDGRVLDEDDAVVTLARLCGHLPLALRLAAAHLVSQPGLPIAAFVTKLLRENRLTTLDIEDDPHIGVRAAFESSYLGLPEASRRTFRLLSLHPGPDIGFDEVVALTGSSPESVRTVIDTLVSAHLVQRGSSQRYTIHDLVNLFAHEHCEAAEAEHARRDALSRLFDWYLHTAKAAMKHVYSDYSEIQLVSSPPHDVPVFDNYDSATEWLDAEYPALISAISHGATSGWPAHTWQLADVLDYFFYLRNRIDDWLAIHQTALTAARGLGDQYGEGRILHALGAANMFAGKITECIAYQRQALALSRTTGDQRSEAYALGRIGYSLLWTGEFSEGIEGCLAAIELYRKFDDKHGETVALIALGAAYLKMGRHTESRDCLQRCLDFDRMTGNRSDEEYTLILLGDVHDSLGDLKTALDLYQQSAQINQSTSNRRLEANSLNGIGRVYRKQERWDEALDHHKKALDIARETLDRTAECEIQIDLGNCLLVIGDLEGALEHHQGALENAFANKDRYMQGIAHSNVARTLHALSRTDEAMVHWQTAFNVLSPMGVPEAEEVAEQMRKVTDHTTAV